MATQSPIILQAAATAGLVKTTLLTALIERTAYVLGSSEVLSDLTQPVGMIYKAVHSQLTGYAYYYNASDTTTVDDGITCLVDADGRRYLIADGADLNISTVLGSQNAPPGSPVVGDSYIVGVAPTGAWAGHASDVALWTLRGWVFAQPSIGMTVYRQDTAGNVQYNAAGNWVGFAISFSAGSIMNSALVSPFGIPVEAQQNAPPVSPTTGQWYLVGTAGSGAWAGQNNAIAYWNGTAWVFTTPYDGATVYNRSTDTAVSWNGTAWSGLAASSTITYDTPGSFTWNKPGVGVMAMIEVIGAGGSGGKGFSFQDRAGCGGGGGAAPPVRYIPLADLPSSVTVAVGGGGASQTTGANGVAGGNSSFGTYLTGYGGAGGAGNPITTRTGGGGGGVNAAGSGVTGGGPTTFGGGWGGGNGGTSSGGGAAPAAGSDSINGGGGGGANGDLATNAGGNGGASYYGGGGGGSRSISGTAGTGGVSVRAGNGGAGAIGSADATAGAQPGGGGGGSHNGNSGKGGDGRVRITVY